MRSAPHRHRLVPGLPVVDGVGVPLRSATLATGPAWAGPMTWTIAVPMEVASSIAVTHHV